MQTIKGLRAARGWSQLKLANELGVTPSTVFKWEAGRNEPRVSQMRALGKLFGVNSDDIELVEDRASKRAA